MHKICFEQRRNIMNFHEFSCCCLLPFHEPLSSKTASAFSFIAIYFLYIPTQIHNTGWMTCYTHGVRPPIWRWFFFFFSLMDLFRYVSLNLYILCIFHFSIETYSTFSLNESILILKCLLNFNLYKIKYVYILLCVQC